MENEQNMYFDLSMLVEQDILKTGQAEGGFTLSVNEYFALLHKFINLAPKFKVSIKKFINRDGNKDAFKCLDNMAALLKNMKCDMFIADIYSILNAYEQGNWRLAAHYADGIANNFSKFYLQVMAARRATKTEDLPDTTILLKVYLKRFVDDENEIETKRIPVILAVDDSPVMLNSISSVLKDEYKVFTLPKPTEVERALKRLVPDLFLLDYQMPELNGFELVPIIRSFEGHKDTPIIFLTSKGTINNVSAALALGACDFIVKPFNPKSFRGKIAKALSNSDPDTSLS